jgi:hypothetical protein
MMLLNTFVCTSYVENIPAQDFHEKILTSAGSLANVNLKKSAAECKLICPRSVMTQILNHTGKAGA